MVYPLLSSGKDEEQPRDPVRLSQKDLDKLKIVIAGFPFYNFSGILACIDCGLPAKVQCHELPDKEVNYFITFNCSHYNKPKEK